MFQHSYQPLGKDIIVKSKPSASKDNLLSVIIFLIDGYIIVRAFYRHNFYLSPFVIYIYCAFHNIY